MNSNILFREWHDIWETLDEGGQQRLHDLLSVEDELQVRSTLELLLSFGHCALCMILHIDNEQFYLKDGLSCASLWKVAIVEQIILPGQPWRILYDKGYFDAMAFDVFGSFSYIQLSEPFKAGILMLSKREVSIPAGSFDMGCIDSDEQAYDNEYPRHKVILTQGLSACIYPVTQGLYECVMESNPSRFKGVNRPVEQVSWCDAVLFCNRLSRQEGFRCCYEIPDGLVQACMLQDSWTSDEVDRLSKEIKWNQEAKGYRLPTEAEW